MQARDFMSMEHGDHAWTRALPLNERDVKDGDCQLDAISLTVKGHTIHALLLERPLSTAASFFESLAHEWQYCEGRPSDNLLDRTIIAVRAQVQLLECVHGRKRSFGGDPLSHLHLSPLKDGHFKTAVAKIVPPDGKPCAIMLGRATHMQTSTRLHRPGCSHAKAQPVTRLLVMVGNGGRGNFAALTAVSLGCLQELCAHQLPFLVLRYNPCLMRSQDRPLLLQTLLPASCLAVAVMRA